MLAIFLIVFVTLIALAVAWGFFAKQQHRTILQYRHMLENHHGLDNTTFHQQLRKKEFS